MPRERQFASVFSGIRISSWRLNGVSHSVESLEGSFGIHDIVRVDTVNVHCQTETVLKQNPEAKPKPFPNTPAGEPPWPRNVAAMQVERFRTRRGWSQERLADELTSIGHSTTRLTVLKTENGDRKMTVDELAAYGIALGVPVVMFLTPIGIAGEVRLTSTVVMNADLARRQMVGDEPYITQTDTMFCRDVPEWKENCSALLLFRRLHDLWDRGMRITVPEAEDPSEPTAEEVLAQAKARTRLEEAVRQFMEHRRVMSELGLVGMIEPYDEWSAIWEGMTDE